MTDILETSSFEAGKLIKAHGVNGKLVLRLNQPVMDIDDFPEWIFIRINGQLVPFRITEESVFLKDPHHLVAGLDEIGGQQQARELVGHSCNLPGAWSDWFSMEPEGQASWIGFSVVEKETGQSGIVTDFQEIPGNPLIEIELAGKSILVPFNPEYVLETDPARKTMIVRVPQEFFHLY